MAWETTQLLLFGLFCIARAHDQSPGLIYADPGPQKPSTRILSLCKRFSSSSEYDGEVCGTNGITYPNVMYLNCLNRHLDDHRKIHPVHSGACKTDNGNNVSAIVTCENNLLYAPVCADDNQTYANVEALNCKNSQVPGYNAKVMFEGECRVQSCPCREPDHAKVCASNGITYKSVGEVRCLKKYNPDLEILHSGGCTIREVRVVFGRRLSCHMARNRYEWNPVCGQNNKTYANPYVYICHHPPGEGKCAARPGECGTLKQLACGRAVMINKKEIQSTSLVCGSNGITYRSYEHLHCATALDRYLEAVSTGRCKKSYNPCIFTKNPMIGAGEPVCGSDKKSYVSVHALWCIRRIGKRDLRYVHDGPCL